MSRLAKSLFTLGIFLIAVPTLASGAAAHKGALQPDFCHVWSFSGGGTFNAAVTHSHKKNDMYQIVCEPGGEICWAFSFNTGNGGTMLTAGLTDSDWEWWVCAWADNAGKTKYQAFAEVPGADLARVGGLSSEPVEVDLGSASAPAGVRQQARRLHELVGR